MKKFYISILLMGLPFIGFSQATILFEDFEGTSTIFTSSSASGNGTPWQLTSTLSKSGTFSDSNNVQLGDTLYLTSQAFSTQGLSDLELTFSHIAKIYLFDQALVEVSADNGLTWTQLGASEYLGAGFLNSNTFSSLSYSTWLPANNTAIPTNSWWKEEKFDISMLTNSVNAKIRFVLIDPDNNGARGNYGWLIDDVAVTTTGKQSPHTYLFEDFNSGIPNSWTNTAISGSFDWMHGKMFDVTDNVVASFDGTAMVYFNDDSLGQSQVNNTVEITTPVISPIPNIPLLLEFDYNYRMLNGATDYFRVEVFNGNSWIIILNKTNDDCGRWVGPCVGNLPRTHIDITSYINNNLQVRFTFHDGNDWAYWAAFDNVHIYSPDEYYPVGTINTVNSTGVADSLFVRTWTSGTVAGVDLDSSNGYRFTIIDQSTGIPEGISIQSTEKINNYVVKEGDSILLLGLVDQKYGLQQFIPDSIVLLDSNKNLPAHQIITALDESTESKLVSLTNAEVVSIDPISSIVGLYNGNDTLYMKVEDNTNVDDSLAFNVGNKFCNINGIGGQADSLSPFFEGYYLSPMHVSDIGFMPTIDLGMDTSICNSAFYTLDAGPEFVSYTWNTGDTSRQVQVNLNNDSLYIVVGTNKYGCSATDTVIVDMDICSGIKEVKGGNISIYPNPSTGKITLEAKKINDRLKISVMDFGFRLIKSIEINSSKNFMETIDLSDHPKGSYIIKIQEGNKIQFEKIIIL